MRLKHRCLARMVASAITLWNAPAFAQSLPQCVVEGSASANGSGIVYIQYDLPAPVSNSCAANFSAANGAGLVFVQYDIPPPAAVLATDGTYAGKVVVSWTAGATGAKYFVYRDGQLISPAGGITTTSFEDTTAEGYRTYSYTVTAGQDSGVSDQSAADTGYSLANGTALNLAATDGTVTNRVDLSWTKIAGSDGYKVYRNNVLIKTLTGDSVISYSDTDVGGSATKYTYSVAAYKGSTETSKSQDQGYANQPPSEVSGTIIVPMDRQSEAFIPTVVDPNQPNDSFTYAIVGQPSNGTVTITNNQILYTPNIGFQGEDTFVVQATDRAGATTNGTMTIRIDCPLPLIYGLNVSGDLSSMEGLAQVEACGTPDQVLVRLQFINSGRTVRDVSVPLSKVSGSNKYYTFADSISSLQDGTYTVSATLTDSYSHTASANKQIVVDWNAIATPKFTYKGSQIYTGGTTAESLGNVGVK